MLGLRTCIYRVPELEKAKQWYAKVFRTEAYFDEPFYVGFEIAGYELGLMPDQVKVSSDNVMTYWGVEDIDTEFARCLELGAAIHEEPNNVGGDIMVASIIDPWGNVIGLIYNPHFHLH